jgi:hypothetical protein
MWLWERKSRRWNGKRTRLKGRKSKKRHWVNNGKRREKKEVRVKIFNNYTFMNK